MKKVLIILMMFLLVGCNSKKEEIKQEEKINKMIDLSSYSREEIIDYADKNNLKLSFKEVNSNLKKDFFVSQNIKKDTKIKQNDELIIEISSGHLANDEYIKYNVNELGRVPVMMYHGIHNKNNSETSYTGGNVDKDGYQRTKEAFEADLEFYYQSGYRMIRLEDYINGIIDVELGKSPIILTFDDGLKNNINILGLDENGELIIDPNSAVGILEAFKEKYPDFNVTATFFINGGLFEQPEYNDVILKWLIKNGYDVGNHTYSHVNFKNVDSIKTQEEVGKMYQLLSQYLNDDYVNIVALPFGSPGTLDHANFPYILNGNYAGLSYETESCLRVGWEADYSPYSNNFNKKFIKRIRAYDNNGLDFDVEANFKILENNRYISDGSIYNIVVSKEDENKINNQYDLNIITY